MLSLINKRVFFALCIALFTGCSFTSNEPKIPQNDYNQTASSNGDFSRQTSSELLDEDDGRADKEFGSFFKKYLNTRAGGDCSGFVSIVNAKYKNMYFDEKTINAESQKPSTTSMKAKI